jgi:hypothetical protein
VRKDSRISEVLVGAVGIENNDDRNLKNFREMRRNRSSPFLRIGIDERASLDFMTRCRLHRTNPAVEARLLPVCRHYSRNGLAASTRIEVFVARSLPKHRVSFYKG